MLQQQTLCIRDWARSPARTTPNAGWSWHFPDPESSTHTSTSNKKKSERKQERARERQGKSNCSANEPYILPLPGTEGKSTSHRMKAPCRYWSSLEHSHRLLHTHTHTHTVRPLGTREGRVFRGICMHAFNKFNKHCIHCRVFGRVCYLLPGRPALDRCRYLALSRVLLLLSVQWRDGVCKRLITVAFTSARRLRSGSSLTIERAVIISRLPIARHDVDWRGGTCKIKPRGKRSAQF